MTYHYPMVPLFPPSILSLQHFQQYPIEQAQDPALIPWANLARTVNHLPLTICPSAAYCGIKATLRHRFVAAVRTYQHPLLGNPWWQTKQHLLFVLCSPDPEMAAAALQHGPLRDEAHAMLYERQRRFGIIFRPGNYQFSKSYFPQLERDAIIEAVAMIWSGEALMTSFNFRCMNDADKKWTWEQIDMATAWLHGAMYSVMNQAMMMPVAWDALSPVSTLALNSPDPLNSSVSLEESSRSPQSSARSRSQNSGSQQSGVSGSQESGSPKSGSQKSGTSGSQQSGSQQSGSQQSGSWKSRSRKSRSRKFGFQRAGSQHSKTQQSESQHFESPQSETPQSQTSHSETPQSETRRSESSNSEAPSSEYQQYVSLRSLSQDSVPDEDCEACYHLPDLGDEVDLSLYSRDCVEARILQPPIGTKPGQSWTPPEQQACGRVLPRVPNPAWGWPAIAIELELGP